MPQEQLIHLLVTYKYLLLVPFALLEGHVVSLVAGFVARTGQINPFLAWACIIFGNLLGDAGLYWLGFFKGERFLKRWGKYLGANEERLAKAHTIYHSHKHSILFFSKLTNGLGLATAVLFLAGVTRINFRTYMAWNFLGECLWTGALLCIGYFLGNIYTVVDGVILKVGLVTASLLIITLLFLKFRSYLKAKLHV